MPSFLPLSRSLAELRQRDFAAQAKWLSFSFALLVFSLASPSHAQLDPVADFCRRFGHQTAVIDRKLYIDGGFINYNPLSTNDVNYTNTYLSYQDLDVTGAGGMPQLYANLSKNATIPSVNGGILWADDVNKKFYLYGGEYSQGPPDSLVLYAYDALNNYWDSLGDPPGSINRVSYGAGVSVSDTGSAYYFGGWLSNNSVPGWTGSKMATSGLVTYTMDTNQWSNNTGPDDGKARAEGVMVYMPVSDRGMLVYFGGLVDGGNGTMVGQPMNEIFLYDIATSKWYTQNATGNVPAMRSRFCAGITWAPDRSSYNVYLYGGYGMPPNTTGFDDVYILSMPSFTWIQMYGAEQYPHNMLSCNVIDQAQMIIIGGSFPVDQTTCDAPDQYGSHSLDMGEQNADKSPWWLYRSNITSYVVPQPIIDAIGGNAQGAATQTAPSGGFNDADVKVLITRTYNAPTRTPTRDVSQETGSSGSKLSTGAIIGIAIGGAAALIILLSLCFCCLRRHRRRRRQTLPPHGYQSPDAQMGQSFVQNAWSPHPSQRTASSPGSPFTSTQSPFLRQTGIAPLQTQPAELGGDTPLHEIADAQKPAAYTPSSTLDDPTKYGSLRSWGTGTNSVEAPPSATVYSGTGFTLSELDSQRTNTHSADSPRHQTYYHR